MAATTPYMGLKVWNSLTDSFDHTQLAENFAKIDQHNHAEGHGVQIPTAGIVDGAISTVKLGLDSVTDEKILKVPVRGLVTAEGVITLGTGFTSSKTATGTYKISFSPTLPSIPVIVGSCASAAGSGTFMLSSATTTEAVILTYSIGTTPALTSFSFGFIAYPS